ncbi:MAG TPA: hypothetical protein VM328_03890 [Fimbriimonadaceae bacterium]|nr:hypothetical protein [Fimbriimonadaceae bacterium]
MNNYEAAMQHAADIYADGIAALRAKDIAASVTQTGGMCLAIEGAVPNGRGYWLLTGSEGPLPWDREADLTGWGLGIYDENGDEVVAMFDQSTLGEQKSTAVDAAVRLVYAAVCDSQADR